MSATRALLDFAGADHVLTGGAREAAIRLLGDTLAIGAAGLRAPGDAAIVQAARKFGAGQDARLLGSQERLPAPSAAFVNGYRVHCLEWDAVHEPAVVHAMSVVTAALGAAIVASDMDAAGFAGPKDPLEGPFGFYNLFESGALDRYTRELGQVWRIEQVSTKPFPSGRASHAILGKLQEIGLDPNNIASLEIAAPPLIRRLVDRPYARDMSSAWARLCMPYLAALMLTDGLIDPRRFTPECIADEGLASLAGRVRMVADGNDDPNALFPQQMTVTTHGGSSRIYPVDATLGSPDNPLSEDAPKAKLDLARELAPSDADMRIFTDPLAYFTEPA